MIPAIEPLLLPHGDGHLFAIRHRCCGPLRARLLLSPPILQEHARSYRFFAQFAEQLAQRGVEVIRFDYRGSGDSSGASTTFTPSTAIADIRAVWDALMDDDAQVPRILCGVRFGSLLAAHAIEHGVPADLAWWWQPVMSGERYLDDMEAIDWSERTSRSRFPNGPAPDAVPGELMGFALDPACLQEVRSLRWPNANVPTTWLIESDREWDPAMHGDAMRLPSAYSAWSGQVDFEAIIPIKLAAPVCDRLVASLADVRR